MENLSKHLTKSFRKSEEIKRRYHLSYDVIDCENDFNNKYEDAKYYLLEILSDLGVTEVYAPCASTIIFTHHSKSFRMATFKLKIKEHFYFSLGLISKTEDKHKEKIFPNLQLNIEVQKMWKKIKSFQ